MIQLLFMQLSPFPCHLVPFRSKYSPQHPILKHPFTHFSTIFSPCCFVNCAHGGKRFVQKIGKYLTTCTESHPRKQQSSLLYRQESKTHDFVVEAFVFLHNCVLHICVLHNCVLHNCVLHNCDLHNCFT